MKILYFDCFNGVSANLLLSAFIDAGVTKEYIMEKLSLYSFELLCQKREDDFTMCTKAEIVASDDKIISSSEALKLAQNILDDVERCFVVMAVKKLKKMKMSQYLTICACAAAYGSMNVNYAVSSYLLDGVGYDSAAAVPSADVLDIIQKDNLPYKISQCHRQLLFADGVSVISTLAKEYGPMPQMDIIKIAYGTDGENYLRIVVGTPKRREVSDFFEMSLDFESDAFTMSVCGEK